MRTTVVYILRLLVDNTEPDTLRGTLRNVTNGEEHAFSCEQGLLELLHFQVECTPETTDANQATPSRRTDV